MKRLALILFGLIAVLLASYQPPPWFAKRLYIFPSSDSTPFDPTGVYRDTLNYRLGGYFALFGTDTSYSLRIWPGVATGRGLTFRQVSGTGDTTRIDSVGIYTSGRVTGTHYGDGSNLTGISGSGTVTSVKCSLGVTATTNPITSTGTVYVDTPTVHGWVTSWSSSGSTDSIQRGVWLGSGWLKNDSTANVDSGAVGTWGDLRWLGLLGKAADATGADSADVGVVSRSCTGNAATATNATTADSSTGGATRATLAAQATVADSSTGGATRATTTQSLQGHDTTALFNAKTLQGQDTTALWNAKTLEGLSLAAFKESVATWIGESLAAATTVTMAAGRGITLTSSGDTSTIAINPAVAADKDSVNAFTKQYYSTEVVDSCTIAAASAATINWNTGNVHWVQLDSGANTLTMTNPGNGGRYLLLLKQPAAGAAGTVVFSPVPLWSAATAPTLSETNGYLDIIGLAYSGVAVKYVGSSALDLR